jgi:HAE1 family hydrophobic/amphiphilic exporter-1
LKNHHGKRKKSWFDKFIDGFNRLFEKLTGRYMAILNRIVARRIVTFGVLAFFTFGIFSVNKILPSGFVPNEDQGTIYAIIQTPPGSTLEYTNKIAQELQQIAEEVEDIESVTSLAGYEIMTEGRGRTATMRPSSTPIGRSASTGSSRAKA